MYRVGQSTVSRSNIPTLKLHTIFNNRLRNSTNSDDDNKTSKFLMSEERARIECLPFFSAENRQQTFIAVHKPIPVHADPSVNLLKETWHNFTSTQDGQPDPRIVKFVPKED